MRILSKMISSGVFLAITAFAGAQTIPSSLTFEVAPRLPESPVYISAVQVDGRDVPVNKPITLAAGWQQHLAIVITNASPKTVVSGEAEMFFPETGMATANNLVVARTERVGQLPAVARYKRDGSQRVLSADVVNAPSVEVGPGQSFTLNFSQVAEDALIEALRKTGGVTKITFATGLFYFGDNSRWFPGRFGVPGAAPGQWTEVTAAEFTANSY